MMRDLLFMTSRGRRVLPGDPLAAWVAIQLGGVRRAHREGRDPDLAHGDSEFRTPPPAPGSRMTT